MFKLMINPPVMIQSNKIEKIKKKLSNNIVMLINDIRFLIVL